MSLLDKESLKAIEAQEDAIEPKEQLQPVKQEFV